MSMMTRIMKAIRHEIMELGHGWVELDDYWKEHPEAQLDCFHM